MGVDKAFIEIEGVPLWRRQFDILRSLGPHELFIAGPAHDDWSNAGGIIIRQRGTRVHPGENVGMGKDHTLFALINGKVQFTTKGAARRHTVVVVPA